MTDVYSISDAHNLLCNCDSNKNFNLLKILRHIDYIIGSQREATRYFQMTDVYSNCDAVIYNGFTLAKLIYEHCK